MLKFKQLIWVCVCILTSFSGYAEQISDSKLLDESKHILQLYKQNIGVLNLKTLRQSESVQSRLQELNSNSKITNADFEQSFKRWLLDESLTLNDLERLMQVLFLRPDKSERIDPTALAFYESRFHPLNDQAYSDIIKCFQNLKMLDDIKPDMQNPDYIIIQGSTVGAMRRNIKYLNDNLCAGTITLGSTSKICFLVGQRALFESETPEILNDPKPLTSVAGWQKRDAADLPTDERAAAHFIVEQADLHPNFKKHVVFIKADARHGQARAQTEDCVKLFLQVEKPDLKSKLLIFSTNPFILYQEKVLNLTVKKFKPDADFDIHSCGLAECNHIYPKNIVFGVLMDNLARILYVMKQTTLLNQKR